MPFADRDDKLRYDRDYYATYRERIRQRQRGYYLRKRDEINAYRRGRKAGYRAGIKRAIELASDYWTAENLRAEL